MKNSFKTLIFLTMITVIMMYLSNNAMGQSDNNNVISEKRNLKDFSSILVDGPLDINVRQGNQASIVVNVKEEKMLKYIKTHIEDGTLKVSIEKNSEFNWSNSGTFTGGDSGSRPNKISIDVNIPNLLQIKASSSSIVYLKTIWVSTSLKVDIDQSASIKGSLEATSLSGVVAGSGHLELAGKCNSVKLTIKGSAVYDAPELITKNTILDLSGSSTATINSLESITVNADGNSNLHYTGPAKNLILNKKSNALIEQL